MKLRFAKMHGQGNDLVVLDGVRQAVSLTAAQVRAIADRHFGVGCDQLLLVEADVRRMNAFIEERVREIPEQYFWAHKRFKTRPPGEPSPYRRK